MTAPGPTVVLRPTRAGDLDRVRAMESGDDTRDRLGDTSPGWHAGALDDPGCVHLLVCAGDGGREAGHGGDAGDVVGFVVLAGPRGTEEGVELRRIVIADGHRGQGLGRAALRAVAERVFTGSAFGLAGDAGPTRLWLDVKPDNHRALALYESEGFVRERVLPRVLGEPGSPAALVILARRRDGGA